MNTPIQTTNVKTIFTKYFIAIVFSIAFGYIEAAVVVYLRAIFYTDGFTFPLTISDGSPLWNRFLLTEIGREAATLVLITTASLLFGKNLRQRTAYFLTIFAVWDIFYYIWLKVLLNWPVSIMDWDILFLIPLPWAGPVLAPVIVSILILLMSVIILYYDYHNRTIRLTFFDGAILFIGAVIIIGSFCIAGLHSNRENYKDYFYWLLFATGLLPGVAVFIRCIK
jgi:hypothetical protein